MSDLVIFLADDHEVVREGFKLLINAQPDMRVIGEAIDGKTACRKVRECQPDVVVMDISMPEMNGVQATEELKRSCPNIKVLALTVHEDTSYLRRMRQAGASGYMLKRGAATDLIHAIRVVAAGGVYIDPTLASKVIDNYSSKPLLKNVSQDSQLSDREEEVLRLIAWGYSNKEIATQLNISVKTVETYKARLFEKLKFKSRIDIVRYALRQGWLQDT